LVIDQSEGLAWEIDFVLSQGHVAKTLILLRPGDVSTPQGTEMLQAILERSGTALVAADAGPSGVDVMAAWPALSGAQQLVLTSTRSAYAYLLTLRAFFRRLNATAPAT